MNKIVILLIYFGKLKNTFNLWLESAKRNKNIDFILFVDDCRFVGGYGNVTINYFSLEMFNELAVRKLGVRFKIVDPYKLCDFKPMYGVIFEDFIKYYDYWGFGDLDVIYGDIMSILNKIEYRKYLKINFAGHLCFMKNVFEINNLFKTITPDSLSYLDILEGKNVAFDERDINYKAKFLRIDIFDGIIAADLNCYSKKMNLVCGKDLKTIFNIKQCHEPYKRNYRNQLFVLKDGRVKRYYRKFLHVYNDEFCYLHFRKELSIFFKDYSKTSYLISFKCHGFFNFNLKNIDTFIGFVKIQLSLFLLSIVRNKLDM